MLTHNASADGAAEPLDLLRPFLAVIVDAEASGPVTAAALGAVRRLLACPFLTLFEPAAAQAALRATVAALTACKFEATDAWHDQLVLCTILHTLAACLEGPAARWLRDADVCAAFQAVYRIGFDTQVMAELSGAAAGARAPACASTCPIGTSSARCQLPTCASTPHRCAMSSAVPQVSPC